MKKGDIVALNAIFSNKVKLPAMSGDQLYAVLSAKADIAQLSEEIEARADKFRQDTKPANVDEYNAKLTDPAVKAWFDNFMAMRVRLFNEDFEGTLPAPCLDKDIFPDMCEGLTPGEAMLIMSNLVKK